MKWCKEEKLKFIKEMEINYGVRYSENDEIVPLYHYLHHNGKQLDSQRPRQDVCLRHRTRENNPTERHQI